ncbi:MAG: ABC transporter permease [Planctomycetaceae bacterium]|nr:ABC transporter permease [Planctomycetaceae bacterium]
MKGAVVIIERELLALLRSSKALAILLTVAIGFALVIILKWPTNSVADRDGLLGKQVFQWLTFAMLIASILIIPVFPATSLVKEVQRRTLELLLNSPLSRPAIYFGKVGAMMGFVLMLMFATLPAMSCCYLMGGPSLTKDVLRLYLFLLVVCLQLTVIGMLVGTWCRSTEAALRWSYGVTFGLLVVTVFPDYFLRGGESIFAVGASWLKLLSPIPALMRIVESESVGGIGLLEQRDVVLWYLFFATIFIVVGSVIVIHRLNHALLDRSRSQGLITDDRSTGVQVARRVFFLIDPQKRSAGIPWFLNPVMVKEFRSRQFGRLHWLLRLVAGCAVLSLLLTLATTLGTIDWGVEAIGGLIIVLQVSLIVLMTPGLSGGMIAGEIEGGGWNLLRVTPMGPLRILSGKLISVCITLALLLCATLPGYAIIMLIKPVLQEQVTQVVISLIFAAVLSMLMSATVSSFFRATAAATSVAYGALIMIFAGPILIWMNRNAPFGHTFVERCLTINPMAAALNAIRAPGFESYDLIPMAWKVTSGICVGLIVVLYARIWKLSQPD